MLFRSKETRLIKVLALLPDVENPFYSAIAEGICDMARKKNCMVLLCTTASEYENEQKFLQMLSLNLADGAILCSSVMEREELRELNQKYPLIQWCEHKEKLECVPNVTKLRLILLFQLVMEMWILMGLSES